MSTEFPRSRYIADSVGTASPARLVTMLYDRLVRDLATAEAALAEGEAERANEDLLHAQDIVWELLAGLDPSRWDGGPALASIYRFLLTELVAANVGKDAERVASCRQLVDPLHRAWHQAAEDVAVAARPLSA